MDTATAVQSRITPGARFAAERRRAGVRDDGLIWLLGLLIALGLLFWSAVIAGLFAVL